MRKSAYGIKKWFLSLIIIICFVFTTSVMSDINAEENDIALEYTLSDGMIIRLTAPPSAFLNYDRDNLFLQVGENVPKTDITQKFISSNGVNTESVMTRFFDIHVMCKKTSTLQNDSALSKENSSSVKNSSQTESNLCAKSVTRKNTKESLSISTSTEEVIQPQGKIIITIKPLKSADTGVKVYHINEKNGEYEDTNAHIDNTGEIVMKTDYFSQFVMVSPKAYNAPNYTAVTATVNWIGGNSQIRPTSSTVRLFAEATLVPQSEVILSADNQWTHTWKNLNAVDSSGNKIRYIVQQDAIPNTTTEMQFINQGATAWIPTNTFVDGQNYVLADSFYSMGFDSSNMQNIQAVQTYFTTELVNGESINTLKLPNASTRWTVIKSDTSPESFYLKNGSSYYLRQNKDESGNLTNLGTAYANNPQNQTLFTYTNAKTLVSNSNTWVKRNTNYNYTYTTDSIQATPLTLYRELPIDNKVNIINDYQPKDPSIGGKVDYHKRIDFLGDKAGNPDTALTGKDDYRLYLDVASGIKMPADMVLVLDVSGSMDTTKMTLLNDALIGKNEAARNDSFIYRFLNAHPGNHLSIVYFWGARTPNWNRSLNWAQDNKIINGQIPANQDVGDATIYQKWMTASDLPRLPALIKKGSGGTDYGAGLFQAQTLLDKPPSSSGSTQYMVFMSDGEPTHGLSSQSTSSVKDVNAVYGKQNEYVPSNLHTPTNIYRYGSGEGNPYNMQFCKNANKTLVKNFALSNPELNIFSVGVGISDPEVLQNLDSGTGRYLDVGNFNELDSAFSSILGPGNIIITDTLSEYVNFASTNHMILTSKSGTTVKTLWANNAITSDGKGIVKSVVIDTITKKVTATFMPTFILVPNTVYTLSFNVQITPKAYEEYALNGYSMIGDLDTDYGKNKTSSDFYGFYSNYNEQTSVSYVFGVSGTPVIKLYQKPVVQVPIEDINLNILKTDDTLQQTPLLGAEFQLFYAIYDTTKQAWIKNGEMIEMVVTNKNGIAIFTKKLKSGYYFLVETKPPPGYHCSKDDVLIKIDGLNGTVIQGKASLTKTGLDSCQAQIKNMHNMSLPATGGIGTQIFFVIGGFILLTALFWLAWIIYQLYKPLIKEGDYL